MLTIQDYQELWSYWKKQKKKHKNLTQQRAKRTVEYMEAERTKRHDFTYGMTVDAELSKAKTSIQRAIEFGDIIKEYINVKKLK
jgi:uncharacterized protein (UPF0332 family)